VWEIILGSAIGVILSQSAPVKRATNKFFLDVLGISPSDLDLDVHFCERCGYRMVFEKPSRMPHECPRCSKPTKK